MKISFVRWGVALALLTPLLCACGSTAPGGDAPGGDAPDGVTSSLLPPAPPTDSGGGPTGAATVGREPANSVTPMPEAVRQEPARWARVDPVPGSASVLVYGTVTGGAPCQVVGRVEVRESASTVVVTVNVGALPGADCSGPQPQVAFPYVVEVALREPLGARVVQDGATH